MTSVSLGHTPISTLTSNLALVACLKEEDRDVREGVRMKTKIELEERKKKSVCRSPCRDTPTSNLAPVTCLKEEERDVRKGVRMKQERERERELSGRERERKQIIKYLSKLLLRRYYSNIVKNLRILQV